MEATESTTTETTALVTVSEEGRELVAFALTFLATAEAVKITAPEEAQAVVDQAKRAKECFKAVEEYRKTLTGPLDEQRKAIMDYFRPACDGLTRAEQLLKGAYSVWDAEQRRLAAVEAEKARKAQEEERKRQEKEQADAAALLDQADAAAARGDLAAAEALENQAAQVQELAAPIPAAMPVNYMAPRAKGASSRTIWKCKVVDPSKLDRAYLMPNQAVLDALAATAKGVGAAPAGCEWVSSGSVSLR